MSLVAIDYFLDAIGSMSFNRHLLSLI